METSFTVVERFTISANSESDTFSAKLLRAILLFNSYNNLLVGDQGFEPRMSETARLQRAAVANAARHPNRLKRWQVLEPKHR